jgi:hypothetical protein
MTTQTIRLALLAASKALTQYARADGGIADYTERMKALALLQRALVALPTIESVLEDLEADSELFEWLLGHLPREGLSDVRPTAYLARGWSHRAAWRQALHDAMTNDLPPEEDEGLS